MRLTRFSFDLTAESVNTTLILVYKCRSLFGLNPSCEKLVGGAKKISWWG